MMRGIDWFDRGVDAPPDDESTFIVWSDFHDDIDICYYGNGAFREVVSGEEIDFTFWTYAPKRPIGAR